MTKFEKLLSDLEKATPEERDIMVMDMSLNSCSLRLKTAVLIASMLLHFDRNTLDKLLPNKLTDESWAELLDLSFVERYPGKGYNIHEASQKLCLKILRTRYDKFLSNYLHKICKLGLNTSEFI